MNRMLPGRPTKARCAFGALSEPRPPVSMSERTLVFVVPGDLNDRTGGYGYDRRIVAGLRATGWVVDVVTLGAGYPFPDASTREHAAQQVAAIPDGSLVVVDGLAFGVMPDLADRHGGRLRWVALVHHPLALETGLAEERRRALLDSERRALATACGVIVTSSTTARELARFGVSAANLRVVTPGTDPAPLATGSGTDEATLGLSLLCVATLIPRKGHTVLIEALQGLQDRKWILHCVGAARDADTAKALRAAIEAHGLHARVRLHDEVASSTLHALYDQADAVVLPSFFEGYGMALAEALARGLPVVSTTAGAIPETVPSGAGILVPPGDVLALRSALATLLDERDRRVRLAAGARAARTTLPTWPQAASRFAAALIDFDQGHRSGALR